MTESMKRSCYPEWKGGGEERTESLPSFNQSSINSPRKRKGDESEAP